MALLEATNVSEGRGTEAPFLLFGAPWMKPESVIPKLPAAGLTFENAVFTPMPDPAAPDPKWSGQVSSGVRIAVKGPGAVAPYRLGIALLRALKDEKAFEWRDKGTGLDRLVGTKRVRVALERGDAVDAIVAADLPAIEAFRKDRQKSLLY